MNSLCGCVLTAYHEGSFASIILKFSFSERPMVIRASHNVRQYRWQVDSLDAKDGNRVLIGPQGVGDIGNHHCVYVPSSSSHSSSYGYSQNSRSFNAAIDNRDNFDVVDIGCDDHRDLSEFAGANQPDAFVSSLRCICLLYTSPSPRDRQKSRMPSSA